MPEILVNGDPETGIDPRDRGFTLGDGVFETIAVDCGKALRWSVHLARLRTGCHRLRLPEPDYNRLAGEARRVIPVGASGVLRITISRGQGPRGYRVPRYPEPTRVVQFGALPDGLPDTTAVRVRICDFRLGVQPQLAGIKHLNRLEQILARAEWSDDAIAEGLLFDQDGWLVEATASNLFLVTGERLYTPRLDRCGVAGVVRSAVLAVAEQQGISYSVDRLSADALASADEVFLTNSVFGLRPVTMAAKHQWEAPGPITQSLTTGLTAMANCPFREE